jgi:CxxC motif-containing protein
MVKAKEYTCIGCPIGCPLQLVHKGSKITEISGNECDRGAKYAKQEFTDPRRELSTTEPVGKGRILEAAREIHQVRVTAPVEIGQVLIKDFLGEKGIDVVACRTMDPIV